MSSEQKHDREPNQTPSLTKKVVRGAKWVFAGRIIARAVEFIKAIVLARLLVPEDFGLFGIVMLALMVSDVFSQTGFNAALIQRSDDAKAYLDTAWTVQIARGILLSLILFLSASFVGWFFHDQRIIKLLKVMSIAPLIQGFINIGVVYFQKELEFHKQFLYDTVSSVVSLLTGIILAFLLRSVWALIWSNISAVVTRFIMSYLIVQYRPKVRFIKSQAKELFRFGKWMSGYTILTLLLQQLDKFFIGKILGPVSLGVYQIAQRIADLPASQIAGAIVNLTLPAYAKIHLEKEKIRKAFLSLLEIVMSLVLPMVVFIFFAAPDIVYGLLGQKWADSIIPIKILSVASFFIALDSMSTPLFVGTGNPNIEFWKALFKVSVLIITIYPMILIWKVTGVCFSIVLSSLVALPLWNKIKNIADIRLRDILFSFISPLILALSIYLSIFISHQIIQIVGLFSLIIMLLISIFMYLSVSLALFKIFRRGICVYAINIIKTSK